MERTNEDILEQARTHFRQCADAETELRRKAAEDLRFLAGEQWPARALAQRARDERPALVVNRLDQFVQHIVNGMRQNRVSPRVFPVDDVGDSDTAEVIQGLLRHIEHRSRAYLAYHTAAFYAVAMGWGYWRIITEYADPLSFDLELRVERLANPFQAYLGPHTMPDGSDAEYGFVVTEMTREQFRREYPGANVADWSDEDWRRDGWIGENTVRVAEYYCAEFADDTLIRLADGRAVLESELREGDVPLLDAAGKPVSRPTRVKTMHWYKLTPGQVLDHTIWPIAHVPIVKVTGHELTVDGKTELKGIIRNLKDAQRQYNYMLSAQTEAVDAAKGQIRLAEGQEEGHEEEWRDITRQKVLRYKATDAQGNVLPPPARIEPNLSIVHMSEARAMAADDLKALTGIYDAALGARSNETSGRGILARQQQSETANFHFQDNLELSITHSCRMLVDLVGKIYDTPRAIRILGDNDAEKVIRINQQFNENGQDKLYDLTVGRYDVVCSIGPSFQTKRQEAAQLLTQLASAAPVLMNAAPDLIIRTYDIPYAQEIADRLAKTLPPGLVDQPGQAKIPPAVAQQLAQLNQMVELLTKELNAKTQLVEGKQLELESRERIEMAKIRAQVAIANSNADSAEAIAALKAEIEALKARLGVTARELAADAGAAAQMM